MWDLKNAKKKWVRALLRFRRLCCCRCLLFRCRSWGLVPLLGSYACRHGPVETYSRVSCVSSCAASGNWASGSSHHVTTSCCHRAACHQVLRVFGTRHHPHHVMVGAAFVMVGSSIFKKKTCRRHPQHVMAGSWSRRRRWSPCRVLHSRRQPTCTLENTWPPWSELTVARSRLHRHPHLFYIVELDGFPR